MMNIRVITYDIILTEKNFKKQIIVVRKAV